MALPNNELYRQGAPARPETAWEVFLTAILLCLLCKHLQTSRTSYKSGSTNRRSRVLYEFSFIVFAVAGRSLPSQSSYRDGAADADAGREREFRAAAAERGILRPARDAGRPDHCRSLARDVDGTRQCRQAGHLFGPEDRG